MSKGAKTPVGTPADPTIEFEKLVLGGEEFSLCYSFYGIAIAEKAIGRNLLSAFGQMMISVSEMKDEMPWELTASDLLGLFYAGLITAHPDMTIFKAGQLINSTSLGEIHQAIGRAYGLSMPKKEPGRPPEAGAAAAN